MCRDKASISIHLFRLFLLGFYFYNAMCFTVPRDEEAFPGKETTAKSSPEIPNMITRAEWGAVAPRVYPKLVKLTHPVPYVIFTYFLPRIDNDKIALQAIQRKHQVAGQPDIQSNFMIGGDGKIYEGRGWDYQPADSIDLPEYNGKFIDIAYIGDFSYVNHSHPIFKASWLLLEYGRDKKYLHENFQLLSDKDKHNTTN